MPRNTDLFTIGSLARTAGLGVETIRFYQREGLLRTPQRPYGGIRRYKRADVARLRFIKRAQRIGFSLREVGGLLTLEDGTHCRAAAEIAAARLADVRAKLADLTRIEAALSALLGSCRTRRGTISCPLIAALRPEEEHPTREADPPARA